jgi:hypothetical protein
MLGLGKRYIKILQKFENAINIAYDTSLPLFRPSAKFTSGVSQFCLLQNRLRIGAISAPDAD